MLPLTWRGITEASATRNPSMPMTRNRASTTDRVVGRETRRANIGLKRLIAIDFRARKALSDHKPGYRILLIDSTHDAQTTHQRRNVVRMTEQFMLDRERRIRIIRAQRDATNAFWV